MRVTGFLVAALLVGCGGESQRSGAQSTGGDASVNGGSSAGATARGGSGSTNANDGGAPPDMVIDGFESSSLMSGPGLWMGFPDSQLPIGDPSVPHDGAALHLVGVTDAAGLDVFFHTGIPVERIWSAVHFTAQSNLVGARLLVAIAGPEASYFRDAAQGMPWPVKVVLPTREWQNVNIDFAAFGYGPEQLSPHSGPFGAVHFIIEPNTVYDVWIDDFAGTPLYR
jgi:hypothetical protein